MIILTTTYNCENYIEKCLFSIMSQKFTDFKCYITDDLSTDKTVTIIKNTINSCFIESDHSAGHLKCL